MNRIIEFRGLPVDTFTEGDKFVYGFLIVKRKLNDPEAWTEFYILNDDGHEIEVKEETIGQWSNKFDRLGTKIFEGDYVHATAGKHHEDETLTTDVIYSFETSFALRSISEGINITHEHGLSLTWGGWESFKVTGNIHEE